MHPCDILTLLFYNEIKKSKKLIKQIMKRILLFSFLLSIITVFSFAIYFNAAKAETLEECIKKYQATGLTYDNAKLKCSNIQAPANTQVAPASQTQPSPAAVSPSPTPTKQNVPDTCIQKYMDVYKLSYDEAKMKCYPSQTQGQSIQTTSSPTSTVEDCIKRYTSQTGNTYEDAKAKCAAITPSVQPVTPFAQPITPRAVPQTFIDSCVKKYMEVFSISSDEAKLRCVNVPQASVTTVQRIEKRSDCADLENELTKLSEKLRLTKTEQESANIVVEIRRMKEKIISSCKTTAAVSVDPCTAARKQVFEYEEQLKKGVSSAEQTKIKKAVETQKTRLQNCGVQEPTPGVKNPCDEILSLRNTYEAMLAKEIQIKELVQNGQLNKSALNDLHRQMEFMKKRIEQMQFACQQGNVTVEESPCSRLTKLEMLYSQNQDQNVANEIITLKERCLTQKLSSETAENLVDVEETYKTKIKAVVENTFGQDQVNILKQTEDEKNKLISNVITKAKELDVTNVSIIKKISIGDNKISLDGIEGNPIPVKIEVKGKEINVSQSNGKVMIDEAGIKAEGNVKIEYQDGKLISANSGKEISVLPSEIKEKINLEPGSIVLTDDGTPQYTVKVEVKAKLFRFIPITTSRNFAVDAQTGQSQESAPWWSFLVKY